jgi:hypothetical protein
MIAPGTFPKRPAIATHALERRGVAFVHWLADTCREWPELRQWLCEDFVRDADLRSRFGEIVDGPPDTAAGGCGLADLAKEASAWRQEKARLLQTTVADTPRLYGGRTWQEMEQIVYRYEGGVTDLGVHVLTRYWRKMGARAKFAPELQRAGVELLDGVIRFGESHLLTTLSRALKLLRPRSRLELRSLLGHADWWKLQACIYILQNPRPAYRTRDVRAHLAKQGIAISSLDFRRFTKRHGIRRDERAGRPRGRKFTKADLMKALP